MEEIKIIFKIEDEGETETVEFTLTNENCIYSGDMIKFVTHAMEHLYSPGVMDESR